jgi:hypothetical protein
MEFDWCGAKYKLASFGDARTTHNCFIKEAKCLLALINQIVWAATCHTIVVQTASNTWATPAETGDDFSGEID